MMPRVTVIVTAKDRPAELNEALASIEAQTYRDFEVVLVNDGGEDLSVVAEKFTGLFPLVFLRHPKPRGLGASRNAALNRASGEIISCLDDDDLFYPDHLETLVSTMEAGGSRVVYSDAVLAYYREAGGGREVVERKLIFSRDFDPGALLVYNYIPTPCLAYARSVLGVTGRYDTELTSLVDWDLFMRLALRFRFEHAPRITAEYRKLIEPESRRNLLAKQSSRFLANLCLLYDRYARAADTDPRVTLEQAGYLERGLGKASATEQEAGRESHARNLEGLAAELAAARENPGRARQKMRRILELLG
jgi:glycosyltransferase involved in cell wall biosynthesis